MFCVPVKRKISLLFFLPKGAKISENTAQKLIANAKTDTVCKKTLRDNTQLLCDLGGCGVPSFQVTISYILIGIFVISFKEAVFKRVDKSKSERERK